MSEITPIQTQPLEVKDFSGGMTDNYLGAPVNKFKEAENLLIVKYGSEGKLRTRPGSEIYAPDGPQLPSGLKRVSHLKNFRQRTSSIGYYTALYAFANDTLFYSEDAGAWTELLGPTGNSVFPLSSFKDPRVSFAPWSNHAFIANADSFELISKLILGPGNVPKLLTAGLPGPQGSGMSYTSGSHRYIYRRVWAYTYTTGGATFTDRGESWQDEVGLGGPPNTNPVTFTGIGDLDNGSQKNWDTASIDLVLEFYRTTDGGQNFYRCGYIANGVTSFVDTMSDANLQLQLALYTEGGIPENAMPPRCKIVHVVDNKGFFANVFETDYDDDTVGYFPNRFYQSVPGDIDSVPRTFYVDVDDEITGFSSHRSLPVLMCARGDVFRAEGGYDELGGGSYNMERISTTAGCISSGSVVQTEEGLFWAGIDGFYFTDAYRVLKISDNLNQTYLTITSDEDSKVRIEGKYDQFARRIVWTVREEGTTDNQKMFVLDLNFGISPEMPFTTMTGSENFFATALEFIDSNLIRGDLNGYVFKHSDDVTTDLTVDTAAAYTLWPRETIRYNYVSIATDFGATFVRKFVPSMSIVCRNDSDLSLAITSLNDDGRKEAALKGIRYRGNIVWGDDSILWGDPDLIWNRIGMINEKRRFPAKGLRCQYKQIELSNGYVAISSSDVLGAAAIDAGAKTLTRAAGWPSNLEGYKVAFEVDGFVREYEIDSKAGTALNLIDAGSNLITNAASNFVIRGYPKGEKLFLVSYVIEYALFSQTQKPYRSSSTGEVGAN